MRGSALSFLQCFFLLVVGGLSLVGCWNIVFFMNRSKRSGFRGSALLRTLMIEDELQKLGHAVGVVNDVRSLKLFSETHRSIVHVCIFTKYYVVSIATACKSLNALVFYDMVDNDESIEMLVQLEGRNCSSDRTLFNAIWLVQSERQREIIRAYSIWSYVLHHQHSNDHQWGYEPPRDVSERPLVVGSLFGSRNNRPALPAALQAAFCATHIQYWAIEQQIPKNRDVKSMREVHSMQTQYSCIQDPLNNGESRMTVLKTVEFRTQTNISGDRFGQAAFYLDRALVGLDVGLILPPDEQPARYYRPATRLLHLFSMGIPTLHYANQAYQDITKDQSYGQHSRLSMLLDTASLKNSSHLSALLTLLKPTHRRSRLSWEGMQIASHYDLRSTARRLLDIIGDCLTQLEYDLQQRALHFSTNEYHQCNISNH